MNKRIGRRQLKDKINHLNKMAVFKEHEIRELEHLVSELKKNLDKLASSPDIVPYGLPCVKVEIKPQALGTYRYMPEEYVPEIEDIKDQLARDLVKNLMENGYIQFIDSRDNYACRRPPITDKATYAAKLYVIPWYEAVYNKKMAVRVLLKDMKSDMDEWLRTDGKPKESEQG